MIVTLPKLKNIQVVSMSMTGNRIEVYKHFDKFTGKMVNAYLPILEYFGAPFTKKSLNELNFDKNSSREVSDYLEDYIQQAFFYNAEFTDKEAKLTLGIICGMRIDYGVNAAIQGRGIDSLSLVNGIHTRPSQLYKITGKVADLE